MTKERFLAFDGFCPRIPGPGCTAVPFDLLERILDIVHCKDVCSAPAEASFVQNCYLEIHAELATGFGSLSTLRELSLNATPLLVCIPFNGGNVVAFMVCQMFPWWFVM